MRETNRRRRGQRRSCTRAATPMRVILTTLLVISQVTLLVSSFAPSSHVQKLQIAGNALRHAPSSTQEGTRIGDCGKVRILAPRLYQNGRKKDNVENDDDGTDSASSVEDSDDDDEDNSFLSYKKRQRVRRRVADLARNLLVVKPMPQMVAAVLRDATMQAVDMAVDEVFVHKQQQQKVQGASADGLSSDVAIGNAGKLNGGNNGDDENDANVMNGAKSAYDEAQAVIDEAFAPLEKNILKIESEIALTKKLLKEAKAEALDAIQAVQAAAIAQAQGTSVALAMAEEAASQKVIDNLIQVDNENDLRKAAATGGTASTVANGQAVDVSALTFSDVDYNSSEMAPPFLNEDSCLVPGEPVVRVEKAPDNSRRIFAGIDILASVDDVWSTLTDYDNLQNVIPNLVVNEVLERYSGSSNADSINTAADTNDDDEVALCKSLADKMKGAKLKQVGGAKVAGINFSARTTLQVREWPQGLPDFAHFSSETWKGQSRQDRAKEYASVKLQRYKFPRPFAVSSLPTRDISMQSIERDDGEFRLYQGVWRMQPLPGCAPAGKQAMRLTYAVEISPRAFLPVRLVEGRIVQDLCTNLEAIRDYVAEKK